MRKNLALLIAWLLLSVPVTGQDVLAPHPSKKVLLQDLIFLEIKKLGKQHTPAFIPVAQIEAKGPHLPVGADLYASIAICKMAAQKANGIVGPPISFGNCQDFTSWPGYIVVDTQTLISLFKNYCQSLRSQGFGRLILFVMAGGNVLNTLRLAAGEYIQKDPSADIVVTSFSQVVDREKILKILGKNSDILTSILLFTHPDLVKLDALDNIEIRGEISELRKAYRFRENFRLSHFFPDAVMWPVGKGSSKEIGEKLIEEAGKDLARLCEES